MLAHVARRTGLRPEDPNAARRGGVLALAARAFSPEQVEAILKVWLETPAIGGRHAMRVAKIDSGA